MEQAEAEQGKACKMRAMECGQKKKEEEETTAWTEQEKQRGRGAFRGRAKGGEQKHTCG